MSPRLIAGVLGVVAALWLMVPVLTFSSMTVPYAGGSSSQSPPFGAHLVLLAGVVAAVGTVMELWLSDEPIPGLRPDPSSNEGRGD